MTTCLDKLWLFTRRNDCMYTLNKLISFLIATALAVATAAHKPMLQSYSVNMPDMSNIKQYNYLYWLLFIYFSFQALDELVELYAVLARREKGSIGLLFELNYFLGVGVLGYIGYFYFNSYDTVPQEYKPLENFISYQVTLLEVVAVVTVLMFCCMSCMQRGHVRKDKVEG